MKPCDECDTCCARRRCRECDRMVCSNCAQWYGSSRSGYAIGAYCVNDGCGTAADATDEAAS